MSNALTNRLRNTQIPTSDPDAGLKISEIFYSLQGEALTSGLPTVFVRLTGCPLRCSYCDTTYAFSGGERMSLQAILAKVANYPCHRVCLTGGEPLAQPNAIHLMQLLLQNNYEISLETAGALSVANVPTAVSKVMDLKTPSSGEVAKNLWDNLAYLTQNDQLKIVIADRADYDWAKAKLLEHQLHKKVGVVWFSPMFTIGFNDTPTTNKPTTNTSNTDTPNASTPSTDVPNIATKLAEWMLADALPVRLQLQLHKLIWADAKGK